MIMRFKCCKCGDNIKFYGVTREDLDPEFISKVDNNEYLCSVCSQIKDLEDYSDVECIDESVEIVKTIKFKIIPGKSMYFIPRYKIAQCLDIKYKPSSGPYPLLYLCPPSLVFEVIEEGTIACLTTPIEQDHFECHLKFVSGREKVKITGWDER